MEKEILNQMLQMNLIGLYGIGLAFVLRPLMRRAGSRYCYYLWIIVFLNLVVPTVLTGSFSLIPKQLYQVGLSGLSQEWEMVNDETASDTAVNEEIYDGSGNEAYFSLRNGAVDQLADVISDGSSEITESDEALKLNRSERIWNWVVSAFGGETAFARCLLIVWVFVMVLLFAVEGVQYLKMRRRLENLKPVKAAETDQAVMLHSMKAVEADQVITLEGLETPMLFGFFHPIIYLPASLTKEERGYIIRHELYHRRRKDPVVKVAALCITFVYWYNPLVWLAFHFLGVDMELSCDEAVLIKSDTDIKKAYAASLLKYGALQNHYILTSLTFGEPGLKTRVKNVLRFKKRGMVITVAAVLAIVLLAAGLFVRPSGSEEETASGPETEKVVTEPEAEEASKAEGEQAQSIEALDNANAEDDPLAHTAEQVLQRADTLSGLQDDDYCQILTIHGYSVLLVSTFGTYDAGVTDHAEISATVYFPNEEETLSTMGTAYPLRYGTDGIHVEWNTGVHTIYSLNEESGDLVIEDRELSVEEAQNVYDIPFVTKAELLEEVGVTDEELETAARNLGLAQKEALTQTDGEALTVETLMELLDAGYSALTGFDYAGCENAVLNDPESTGILNYWYEFSLEYEGSGYTFRASYYKSDDSLSMLYISDDAGTADIFSLYHINEGSAWYLSTAEDFEAYLLETRDRSSWDVNTFLLSIDLPDGYALGFWNSSIGSLGESAGSGGGALIEPVAYELYGEDDVTVLVDDWKYYSGFFSRIEEGFWTWEGGTLVPGVLPLGNHMWSAFVEMVENTEKIAYLLEVEYDLYTVSGEAQLEESGLDLNEIDLVSEYWYIIFVDDGVGTDTGYCLGLAKNRFTQEEASAIAQSMVFAE